MSLTTDRDAHATHAARTTWAVRSEPGPEKSALSGPGSDRGQVPFDVPNPPRRLVGDRRVSLPVHSCRCPPGIRQRHGVRQGDGVRQRNGSRPSPARRRTPSQQVGADDVPAAPAAGRRYQTGEDHPAHDSQPLPYLDPELLEQQPTKRATCRRVHGSPPGSGADETSGATTRTVRMSSCGGQGPPAEAETKHLRLPQGRWTGVYPYQLRGERGRNNPPENWHAGHAKSGIRFQSRPVRLLSSSSPEPP